MLTEAEIMKALHASRVVPLDVANPHGPFGLKQVAGAIALARGENLPERIERPIALSVKTWTKLNELAQVKARQAERQSSPSEIAAELLEQLVSKLP